MRRVKGLMGLLAVMGLIFMLPTSAKATLVTIDEIVCAGGAPCSGVLAGTADFTVSGSTLTIVLTNTSTGAIPGQPYANNLITDIGFNLPTGVSIANNGTTNAIALTAGSVTHNGTLTDTTWGAGNNPTALNNITIGGDVNAVAATLQSEIQFNLAGTTAPPANVNGPNFGLVSKTVGSNGVQAVEDSVTITLALAGTVPGNLIALIESGYVVLSFGSPIPAVPEPSTLHLLGSGLVGVGLWGRKKFMRSRA